MNLNLKFDITSIKRIIFGGLLLLALFYILYQEFKSSKALIEGFSFKKAGRAITKASNKMARDVGSVVKVVGDGLANATKAIGSGAIGLVNTTPRPSVIDDRLKDIGDFGRQATLIIGSGASQTADVVAQGTTQAAQTVAEGTTQVAQTVAEGTTQAAQTVAEGTTQAAQTVAEGTTQAAQTVAEGTTQAAQTVAEGTTQAAQTVAEGTIQAAQTVAEGTTQVAETVAKGATSLVQDIISAFDLSVINDLLSGIKNDFTSISSSISSLGTEFNENAINLSNKINSIS